MQTPTEFEMTYRAADGTPIMLVGHSWITPADVGFIGRTSNGIKVKGDFAKVASVCAANQPANDLTQWR